MCGLYVAACLFILIMNAGAIPAAFGRIFSEAFRGCNPAPMLPFSSLRDIRNIERKIDMPKPQSGIAMLASASLLFITVSLAQQIVQQGEINEVRSAPRDDYVTRLLRGAEA